VGVLERPRVSHQRATLPIVLVSSGPGVWLLLWMMVSSPPIISESWVSSVMFGDRDVSGRRYSGETCLFLIAQVWRVSGDAYQIDLGLSQISGIS